jgi:hypothetical protein
MAQYPFSYPFPGQPPALPPIGNGVSAEHDQYRQVHHGQAAQLSNDSQYYVAESVHYPSSRHDRQSLPVAQFPDQAHLGFSQPLPSDFAAAVRSQSPYSPAQPVPERRKVISSVITDELEEGELSESPDEYDPRHSFMRQKSSRQPHPSMAQHIIQQQQSRDRRSPQYAIPPAEVSAEVQHPPSPSSRATSVPEAQATDFYDEEEEGEIAESSSSGSMPRDATAGSGAVRQRSGSYSPYLSAGEIQDDQTPQKFRPVTHGAFISHQLSTPVPGHHS